MDHLFHAKRDPKQLQDIAKRLGASVDAVLASAIAEHLLEEFEVAAKQD